MNEARLKIIDKYLHDGWCSYLDIAKIINDAIQDNDINPYGIKKFRPSKGSCHDSYNKQLIEWFRGSIGQDFMDIPEIWALVHENRMLIRDGRKSTKEDQEYRSLIRSRLIEEELRPQYGFTSNRIRENNIDDPRKNSEGKIDIKKVKFYRYKDRNYSLFISGDYKIYQEKRLKLKLKSRLADATDAVVSKKDVKSVLYESDVILEPVVSDKIKQRIRLQNELKEYEDEVKFIIKNLQTSITSINEEKRRGWIKKTINFYKNILELAKSPLSNIDKRQVANYLHNFALFLASENLYQMLGNRFEEVIRIYHKLVLIQKHNLDDYLSGAELFADEKFDLDEARSQMQNDKRLVAEALFHFARVQFDSHNTDYAKTILEKALDIASDKSTIRAKLLHLRAIIDSVTCNFDSASKDIEEAYKCAVSSDMEETELSEIMMSRAELLRAKGDWQKAIKEYDDVISIYRRDETSRESLASALMSKSMLHLSPGNLEMANTAISEALDIFTNLYAKDPDRILPSLMSARYIQMLIASKNGDIANASEIGERIIGIFDKANETLKTLCIHEVIQTLILLKELYTVSGKGKSIMVIEAKFSEIKNQHKYIIDPLLFQ